jgi:hypothetical protein
MRILHIAGEFIVDYSYIPDLYTGNVVTDEKQGILPQEKSVL